MEGKAGGHGPGEGGIETKGEWVPSISKIAVRSKLRNAEKGEGGSIRNTRNENVKRATWGGRVGTDTMDMKTQSWGRKERERKS